MQQQEIDNVGQHEIKPKALCVGAQARVHVVRRGPDLADDARTALQCRYRLQHSRELDRGTIVRIAVTNTAATWLLVNVEVAIPIPGRAMTYTSVHSVRIRKLPLIGTPKTIKASVRG